MRGLPWLLVPLMFSGCLEMDLNVDVDEEAAVLLAPYADAGPMIGRTLAWDIPDGDWSAVAVRLGPDYWREHGSGPTQILATGENLLIGFRIPDTGYTGWVPLATLRGLIITWDDDAGKEVEILAVAQASDGDATAHMTIDGEGFGAPAVNMQPLQEGRHAASGGANRVWLGDAYGWFSTESTDVAESYTGTVGVGGSVVTAVRHTVIDGRGHTDGEGVFAFYMNGVETLGVEAWRLEVDAGETEYAWGGPGWSPAAQALPTPLAGPAASFAVPSATGDVGVRLERAFGGYALRDPIGTSHPLFALTWAAYPLDLDALGWELQPLSATGPVVFPL